MAGSRSDVVGLLVRPWLPLLCAACTTAVQTPADPGTLAPADRYASADLDGDGTDEVIRFSGGTAYWSGHEVDLQGGVQQAQRGDPDGDGRQALYVATGRSRSHRDAVNHVYRITADGAESLWTGDDGRNRITDLQVTDQGVHIARFGPDKTIQGAWLRNGQLEPSAEVTMGLRQVPLGDGRMAVGRLYGDEPRSHGDLRIQSPSGPDKVLPSVRGVRTLVRADINQDGHVDLLSADGWHYRYGSDARARLTLYLGPDFEQRRAVAEFPGEYTINWIGVIEGEHPTLLAAGNKHLHRLQPDQLGWRVTTLADIKEGDPISLWRAAGSVHALIPGQPGRAVSVLD